MERRKALTWFLFSLVALAVGLLVVVVAVYVGMIRRWPLVYHRDLTSRLVADYGIDADRARRLPPVEPVLLFDLMAEEGVTATLRPGPLATLAAIASSTPTFTPSPTPLPTATPTPSPTATPTPPPTPSPSTNVPEE